MKDLTLTLTLSLSKGEGGRWHFFNNLLVQRFLIVTVASVRLCVLNGHQHFIQSAD